MNKTLILSPGRQVHIINQFHEYCEVCLGDYDLSVLELYPGTPHLRMPRYSSPEYKQQLLAYIKENNIEYILSMSDIENVLLGRYENDFLKEGCRLIGVSYEVALRCLDKYAFFEWLRNNGIDTPLSFLSKVDIERALQNGTITLPLLKKSRLGMASKGLEIIQSLKEIDDAEQKANKEDWSYLGIKNTDKLTIYQECLKGEEYGVDIVNDMNGNFVACCIKKKLAMRNGETDEAVILDDPTILTVAKRLSSIVHHKGNIDCDLIKCGERCFIIDINPRFGGGYIFSAMAGLNVPALLFGTVKKFTPHHIGKRYRRISKIVEIHEQKDIHYC